MVFKRRKNGFSLSLREGFPEEMTFELSLVRGVDFFLYKVSSKRVGGKY